MIDIANVSKHDICLEDIAHALSRIQRFNGYLPYNKSYTVGEHCINLAQWCLKNIGPEWAKAALLHDASEAYMNDIISPIKEHLQDYQAMENKLQNTINTKYKIKLNYIQRLALKDVDKAICLNEVKTLIPGRLEIYKEESSYEGLGAVFISHNNHPSTVKQCFLTLAKRLGAFDEPL